MAEEQHVPLPQSCKHWSHATLLCPPPVPTLAVTALGTTVRLMWTVGARQGVGAVGRARHALPAPTARWASPAPRTIRVLLQASHVCVCVCGYGFLSMSVLLFAYATLPPMCPCASVYARADASSPSWFAEGELSIGGVGRAAFTSAVAPLFKQAVVDHLVFAGLNNFTLKSVAILSVADSNSSSAACVTQVRTSCSGFVVVGTCKVACICVSELHLRRWCIGVLPCQCILTSLGCIRQGCAQVRVGGNQVDLSFCCWSVSVFVPDCECVCVQMGNGVFAAACAAIHAVCRSFCLLGQPPQRAYCLSCSSRPCTMWRCFLECLCSWSGPAP